MQVKEDIFNIGRFKKIKVPAIYGKVPFNPQVRELKQKSHIVVGTPGRLLDHIEKKTLDVSNVQYLVLDEADEMLRMGFMKDMENIIKRLPRDRVNLLLSATMPEDIKRIAANYMTNPIHVEIEDEDKAVDRICQERYEVDHKDKLKLLNDMTIKENPDSCIIFCNTQIMVDDVNCELSSLNYKCNKIHGGMEQRDRLKVMNDFKKGKFRYLVATDVAARGIDVTDISLVINYDVPEEVESYVHRIGRTGRASKDGKAITFVTKRDGRFLSDIHEYIEKEIPLKTRPSKDEVLKLKTAFKEKMKIKLEIKEEKGAKLNKDIMKIHINAGKKTKMRAVDIVGSLCNLKNMTKDDIGIINILDISTYVEVLNGKGESVLKQLQSTPVKGRLRRVTKVDEIRW